jgi:NADH dehydrogenase [ubiquinone] 1 alpha subcomplex assembly factor 7
MTARPQGLAGRLAGRLAARIRRHGPLSVADFMAAALTDPHDGYYTRREPFGTAGDFVTAPEISQMFGEMIGAWCVDCWQRMGRPPAFALAEFGPGRGTLMADLLRVAALDAGFRAALHVHLVETSPTLRAAQRAALDGTAVTWHDRPDTLPGLPLLAIANEFVDALPVRQFERTAAGWCERRVDVDGDGGSAAPAFRFVLSPPLDTGPLPAPADAPIGAIAETCPQGRALATALAARLVADGGAALLVDYGYASGFGDTLQAVRRHRFAPFLADPGEADLTAHVDFAALGAAATAAGAAVHGPVMQGDFLRALGIEARAAALAAQASPAQRDAIDSALRRLIGAREMGTLFKAVAFAAPELPAPAGFAPGAT